MWWQPLGFNLLATFKYTMQQVNYSHHGVRYILSTYLSYNWKLKFVPSDPFSPLAPPHVLPLVTNKGSLSIPNSFH